MLTMICATACLATAALAKGPAVTTAQPSPALGAASAWQPARFDDVKTQVFAWLDGKKADPALRRIPVVVLTTSRAQEDVARTYELGGNSFIIKPTTFQALVEMIAALAHYWFETVALPTERDT